MIRVRGRYRGQAIELDAPLRLDDNTRVELQIEVISSDQVAQEVSELGMDRLEAVWDNPQDAIYDDWKKLYADRVP